MGHPARIHQDKIFEDARDRKRPLTIYLKNGVHIKGLIEMHDNFTVLVRTEKKQTLIYKHSITSLFPARIYQPRTTPRPEGQKSVQSDEAPPADTDGN